MMREVGRSIGIIAGILVCTTCTMATPFSVIDSFKQHIREITSFSASVERVQSYRNVEKKSSGTISYSKRYGSLYDWKTPGRYRFFRSDFGAYGVDLEKQQGWKTEFGTPDPEFSRQIDPLYRLLYLGSLSPKQVTYRGNSGDLLIFSMDINGGKKCFIGFDAAVARCHVIEIINEKGYVTEKTKFYYSSNTAAPAFPESIVMTSVVGSEISTDSLVITAPRVNGAVTREQFAIPAKVTWHKRISAVLPQ